MLLFFSGEMLENKPGTVSKEAVVHVLCPNLSTEQTRTSYVVSSERPIQCASGCSPLNTSFHCSACVDVDVVAIISECFAS